MSRALPTGLVFRLLACGLLAAACGGKPLPPNLILISIDTLRADHLGAHGYSRPTSPALDRFATEAWRVERALAPAPWTLPSHAAMLTGIHPYELGMRDSGSAVPAEAPVLAEALQAAGYQTAAFVDSHPKGFVGAERGFGRGFERFVHHPGDGQTFRDDIAKTLEAAREWLGKRNRKKPFFLFLHTKSVHAVPSSWPCHDHRCFPYDKPDPYRFRFLADHEATAAWRSPERGQGQEYLWAINRDLLAGQSDATPKPADIEQLEALYDAGITYTDFHLGQFFAELEAQGLLQTTAILVTADHGEAFGEHRLFQHQEVFEPTLRVPLLLRLPGINPTRGTLPEATLEDIPPTLLELAGLEPPRGLSGISLLPATRHEPTARPEQYFAYYLFPPKFEYRAFALYRGGVKLVAEADLGQKVERVFLFELGQHGGDVKELPAGDPRWRAMTEALNEQRRKAPRFKPARVAGRAGELETDPLRGLGYLE